MVAIAGGMAIWIIIGPIHRLTEAAEAIGGGALDARIPDEDMEGELLVLAGSFNRMADRLGASDALLEQQVADRTGELETLNRIASVAGQLLDLDTVLEDAVTSVIERLPFEAAAICLVDEATGEVRLAKCDGFPGELCTLDPWRPLVAGVAQSVHREVQRVRQCAGPVAGAGRGGDSRAGPGAPRGQGQVEGVLIAASRHERAVPEAEVELLMSVGHLIGGGVQNHRLHGQASQLAVIEERQRLARDLHDSVTQSLYSVTLYAEAAARLVEAGNVQGCSDNLRHTRDAARSALREMRLLDLRATAAGPGGGGHRRGPPHAARGGGRPRRHRGSHRVRRRSASPAETPRGRPGALIAQQGDTVYKRPCAVERARHTRQRLWMPAPSCSKWRTTGWGWTWRRLEPTPASGCIP